VKQIHEKVIVWKEAFIIVFEQRVDIIILKICCDVLDGIRKLHSVELWWSKYLRQSWRTLFNHKQMKSVFERAPCPCFPLGQSLNKTEL